MTSIWTAKKPNNPQYFLKSTVFFGEAAPSGLVRRVFFDRMEKMLTHHLILVKSVDADGILSYNAICKKLRVKSTER